MDHFGNKIKFFGADGSFRRVTDLDRSLGSRGFYFDFAGDYFFVNIFRKGAHPSKNFLITRFDLNGDHHGGFGRLQLSERFVELMNLNKIFFEVVDGQIFGCFRYRPILFIYDTNGRELFFKDLSSLGIPDIDKLRKEEQGASQIKQKDDQSTVVLIDYFYSLILNRSRIYCAINSEKAARGSILEFGRDGRFQKRTELIYNGKPAMALKLVKSTGGVIYVVFRQDGKNYLAIYNEEVER